MKANHNKPPATNFITELYSNILRTEIESKSQPSHINGTSVPVVFKYIKNWNWKQITTQAILKFSIQMLYSNILRTEIESKSQLPMLYEIEP